MNNLSISDIVVIFAIATFAMATLFSLLSLVGEKHTRFSDGMHDLGVVSISVSLIATVIIAAFAVSRNLEYLKLEYIDSNDIALVSSVVVAYLSIFVTLSFCGRKHRERERELYRHTRRMLGRYEELRNSHNR